MALVAAPRNVAAHVSQPLGAPPEGTGEQAMAGPLPGAATRADSEPSAGLSSLGTVPHVLEELATATTQVLDVTLREASAMRGAEARARLLAEDFSEALERLERVAGDGYQVLLEPTGPGALALAIRPISGDQARGVWFIDVTGVKVEGTPRKGETLDALEALVSVRDGEFSPQRVRQLFANLGYRIEIGVLAPHEVALILRPERSIRRIRIRGHLPLSTRRIRQNLGSSARPGALVPTDCRPIQAVRDEAAPLCDEGDTRCQAWEAAEVARLERFLGDSGYFDAHARLALSCGRNTDEADLWVWLDKGEPARVRLGSIAVKGNAPGRDELWIRRQFRPTVSPFLPFAKRLTKRHVDKAVEDVEGSYAEPRRAAGGLGGTRTELDLPYPGVEVRTNYEALRSEPPSSSARLPLEVHVELHEGVQTEFLGNSRVSDARLVKQLQLFERRERANAATAGREAAHLRRYYQARGYMLASLTAALDDFQSLRRLRFHVKEGPRVRVRRVKLKMPEGLPPVVAKRIRRKWRGERRVEPGEPFVDSEARADLGTLRAEFEAAGYLCARPSMRVAFLPEDLDVPGRYAVMDLRTGAPQATTPDWLIEQLGERAVSQLQTLDRSALYVRLSVEPGARVLTSGRERVRYLEAPIPADRRVENRPTRPAGSWSAAEVFGDSKALRRPGDARAGGIPVHRDLDREFERDLTSRYRSAGYPIADAEIRWAVQSPEGSVRLAASADALVDEPIALCRASKGRRFVTVDAEVAVYEGRRGTFGRTYHRGNFKTRDWVLARERRWTRGDTFDASKVDRTTRNIEAVGVAESLAVEPLPVGCRFDDPQRQCTVHHVLNMTEADDVSLVPAFGLGGATIDPFYAFIQPTFPNLWGTAWDLYLDGHWGFDVGPLRDVLCDGEKCFERSARASLSRPRFLATPANLTLSAQLQSRQSPARGKIDSGLTEISATWPIGAVQIRTGYLLQLANVSKNVRQARLGSADALRVSSQAAVPDRTAGLRGDVSWHTVDNAFNPHEGIMSSVEGMLASPWLGGEAWWARFDASLQHFVPLRDRGKRWTFLYSLRYGHSFVIPQLPGGNGVSSVPEVWRYFGGGSDELGLRGLAPQTMLVDIEEIDGAHGVSRLRPLAQGGHIRALGTVAIQFLSVRNFVGGNLAHSLFLDAGVLTQKWRQVKLQRDLRTSVGVNFIKWDIPNLLTLSAGYAILVPNSIWPGNVRATDDTNGRFVFDVGVTF